MSDHKLKILNARGVVLYIDQDNSYTLEKNGMRDYRPKSTSRTYLVLDALSRRYMMQQIRSRSLQKQLDDIRSRFIYKLFHLLRLI